MSSTASSGTDGRPSIHVPGCPASFAELGAGYGRLGYVVLEALPESKYTILDIPPALYLSQRYLTAFFPERPAFRFRPFRSYEAIAEEFEAASLRFLAPHQLELLPAKSFDYFVNISSFAARDDDGANRELLQP